MSIRTALVVEGGAMRGIFSAGVLDVLLEKGLNGFDLAIGTSAGACNLASFVAGQHERNLRCYTRIMSRKELFDLPRFLRGGHFMDLDWLWTRFEEEDPLDNDAVNASRTPLVSVSTCYESGCALYHRQEGDVHNGLKGGCALPVLYRGPVYFQDKPIVDGGVSDAIPVREAYRRGARRIVVVRSRPHAVHKERGAGDFLGALLARHKPRLARAIFNGAARYRATVELLTSPPADVELVHIAPERPLATTRTAQDVSVLRADYALGRQAAEHALPRIESLLASAVGDARDDHAASQRASA